ncbi:MAG: hypothetical protein JXX28_13885 [Deltaproteobacteria bacterium]|nr:hypothetical protein [Deltaproteobacteria bacterium]
MRVLASVTLLLLLGCSQPVNETVTTPSTASSAALDARVMKAVDLRAALRAHPGQADALLAQSGLDRAAFDALLYEIAEDPALAAQFAAAK